jgi:hypothetical protein
MSLDLPSSFQVITLQPMAFRGTIIPMATPNSLFAIMAVGNPAALELRIDTSSSWLNLKVREGQWLLIAPAGTTTKEISDKLGVTGENPASSSAIILKVESYFGRTSPSTWEWIIAKKGAELGTDETAT